MTKTAKTTNAKKGKKMTQPNGTGAAKGAESTKKETAEIVPGAVLAGRQLRILPVTKITNRLDWNVRGLAALRANDGPREGQTGLGTFAKEDDEKSGIKAGDPVDGMLKMLADDGQKTPIDVFPDPKNPDRFILADGATRYEAAVMLYGAKRTIPGLEKGMIEAYVYPAMTEADAEDWNLARATDHRDLKTADLAFGIARSGKRLSDSAIAAKLGVEQSYVSKLHRIVKNAPAIAKAWRDSPYEIGHIEVGKIAAMAVDEREAAWKALLQKKKGGSSSEGGEGDKGADWLDKAKERAAAAGKILGILHANNVIDASALDFDADLVPLAEAFGIKLKAPGKDGKEATKKQREKIAKEAEETFALAVGKITRENDAKLSAEKAAQAGTAPDVEPAAPPAN